MQRDQLEHLIRAAGAISGSRRLVVIGSQAILGQFPHGAPARATLSMEADLLPIDALEMSEMLTGSLGELSPFHNTFGGYIGLCLEVHDLLLSKYFAGRDKDHEFCSAVVEAGLADCGTLRQRLAAMEIGTSGRARIERKIAADFGQ